ncbi:protein-disulfide reductase DsbD family protein [Salinimicrobium sp. MT39]|uniref:Protein-disulfide reductase DsbD family protein n=1 Tax=Salinimicrobium profundisediminis TaxID=2994553 RepID=A0A9X3I277_9FLAO|nr:cytochrome c biogenesis protein CcdA [Salinimicrobium profundisediminis]MCX2839213.1 protein-disulfide reductase DsbD family protein [Salinimicrobium profundisediminis]
MKTKFLSLLLALFSFLPHVAQVQEAPEWQVKADNNDAVPGDEVIITFTADIPQDWYMYSSDFDPNLGPMLTEFNFDPSEKFELLGEIIPVEPKEKYEEIWEGDVTYFIEKAIFEHKIKLIGEKPVISGSVTYQICSDVTGQCIPYESEFSIDLSGEKAGAAANTVNPSNTSSQPPLTELEPFTNTFEPVEEEKGWMGLMTFFLISFGAGLAALLTPCVFPMIPMTVTFFTKSSGSRSRGILNAVIYGVSIIAIYTLVGTVFALIFGAGFANFLSTHWLPNLLFFAIFVLFALSFFGLFEIRLPNKLVNNIDTQANKGGLSGIFFMAFTLVLVGFSCTGPIAGTILLEAASGQAIKPLIGMLGFSTAFAIPFTLFAIFPGWLSSLPKSGGWLNTVKVVLGFLELALALKFLSMVDQVYHWNLLDREIYLALWIVIFTLLGFYLLGKIIFPHEQKSESTSISRLLSAILVFSFVVYLIPGLFGAPLKALAGYLPPMSTHDFQLLNTDVSSEQDALAAECEQPKYDDFLELPHGIKGYFDYEQALACSKKQNKPIFIDFTGHGCVNCREMEAAVWSDPAVLKRLKEDYIVVAMYVDEKTELPREEWYTSVYDNKIKKTIGKQNMDFMIQKLNANAQPYYTLVGDNEELLSPPRAYDLDVQEFVEFLDAGKAKYEESLDNSEPPFLGQAGN